MVAFRDELGVGTLRVAVSAKDPLVRTALVAALAADPVVRVLDRAEGFAHADAVIWDGPLHAEGAGAVPGDERGASAGLVKPRATDARFREAVQMPLIALVEGERAAAEALGAGARAVLHRESDARILVAAIRAVAGGLLVLGPGYERVRPATPRGRSEPLTAREREVLALLGEARSNKEIAQRLGISEHTAKFHVNAVLAKLGAQRRTEAVVEAARLGLISI